MKKVAVYIRVSTLEQANEGYSIDAQRERLTAFCRAHDWSIYNFFVDGGYTGSNLDRPGIQKLIDEKSNYDLVLVYKLDRLSRSQRDTLYLIEEVFLPAGIDFVSVNESFDTSTPFGRAMIGILSVFAQLEREQIRERTMMGRLARAKDGKYSGSCYDPIGYKYENGTLSILEYEAEQVRRIYELYLAGTPVVQIGEILHKEGYSTRFGRWHYSHNAVSRILDSPLYAGTLKYSTVVIENALPAIVTEEMYKQVQAQRKAVAATKKNVTGKTVHLLTGLVVCGQCGRRFFCRSQPPYAYYTCYARLWTKRRLVDTEQCKNKIWKKDELESYVANEISSLLFDPEYYKALIKKKPTPALVGTDAANIKKRIGDLDTQIARLMDLYANSAIPVDVLSAKIEVLHHEKMVFSTKLEEKAQDSGESTKKAGPAALLLEDMALVWEAATPEERRSITLSLIDRILLNGEDVQIEWAFLRG